MRMVLKRIYRGEQFTVGELTVNGVWIGNSLEPRCIDWQKEQKVMGRTAVPEGTYEVRLSPSRTYRRMMPYLLDVPMFTGVMIHPGNTVADTRGCILVGLYTNHGMLTRSRQTFRQLAELIDRAAGNAERIEIVVC
ncbi:MAG: DUF5675 family protein [Prevotella sp.]